MPLVENGGMERYMKRKIALLGIFFLLVFANISSMEVHANETFTSLNHVIDVGNEIYVQHDENNEDVYELKKSELGKTIVYRTILPEFTAGKAWTKEGQFIENICTAAHGATAPEDYIPVEAGEQYFIKVYGVGYTEGIWYTPILFFDNNDVVITDMLTATYSKSKAGVIITVPENATKMHLTMYNNQNFKLQKVLNLTEEEFDNLPINKTEIETDIAQKYEKYQEDRII